MAKYILKRILELIPIIIVVSLLVFWLMSISGDPVANLMGDQATQEQIEAKREEMGLNRPFIVQYGEYMLGLLKGDLGTSLYGQDVAEQFFNRLPYSLLLCFGSIFLTIILSLPLGIFSALKKGSWFDAGISAVSMFGVSVPVFWLGLLLLLLFAVKLGWLPTSGIQSGVLLGVILPAVTSAINSMGTMTRFTRSSMLDNLGAEFLRTARAKGVKEGTVVWKHALKNALLPIITQIGFQFNVLLGGAITLEIVFAWPGIGNLIITSVRSSDYVMVTGCVIMLTVIVAIWNLLIDISYAFADPRVKAQYVRK